MESETEPQQHVPGVEISADKKLLWATRDLMKLLVAVDVIAYYPPRESKLLKEEMKKVELAISAAIKENSPLFSLTCSANDMLFDAVIELMNLLEISFARKNDGRKVFVCVEKGALQVAMSKADVAIVKIAAAKRGVL